MRLRFGIVLASVLAVSTGACASGTGGAGGGAGAASSVAGLPQGEPPIQNGQTRNADTQLALAMVASGDAALGNYQSALNFAQQAIAQDARNPLPWLQAGKAYIGLHQFEAADSALKRAQELRPVYQPEVEVIRENAWIDLYQEASPLLDENRYEDAVRLFESANLINPRRPELMVVAGQLYLQLGQPEQAITNLQRGLAVINSERINEVDSATAEGWREQADEIPTLLAQAFISAQRYEEAVASLRPLVAADPTNVNYARSLASIYSSLGQMDSVTSVFARLEGAAGGSLSPGDYYVMGLTYLEMAQWSEAAGVFESVMRVAPRDRDAAEWLTRALDDVIREQEGAGAEANAETVTRLISAAEKWIELDPNSYLAHLTLAGRLSRAGDNARAGTLVNAADALPFHTELLDMQRVRSGATVFGDLRNQTMDPGQAVTLRFTFYGENNVTLGQQDVRVTMPPKEAVEPFQVDYQSQRPVVGYTYQIVPM